MEKTVSPKSVTLRRDGKGPLKFKGERISSATRNTRHELEEGEGEKALEISTKLFRTSSGKYILGCEAYNHSDEEYVNRNGWTAPSLKELVDLIAPFQEIVYSTGNITKRCPVGWLDDDILGEIFEETEVAAEFVVQVD